MAQQVRLAEGYAVTVCVRKPSKLTIRHELLIVVQGELHDALNIERTVKARIRKTSVKLRAPAA